MLTPCLLSPPAPHPGSTAHGAGRFSSPAPTQSVGPAHGPATRATQTPRPTPVGAAPSPTTTEGDHPVSTFEDLFAGDGNEDIREAFAAAEKDFSDLESLSAGDDSPGVAVHAVDETDTFGSVAPDGTPLVFAYREEDHGNAAYLVVAMGPDHIVYMPVSYVADIAAWMAARLGKATARGKDLG